MSNILIVGPGRLGGQIAFRSLRMGQVKKVFLLGRSYSRTKGIKNDLKIVFPRAVIVPLDFTSLPEPVDLTFFTFSTLKWTPKIGVNDRSIEISTNIRIIDQIFKHISLELLGKIIVISNPVDILTRYTSYLCDNLIKVFGFGISVDEVRMAFAFNQLTGKRCERVPCVGEHGAEIVPLLSQIIREQDPLPEIYDKLKSLTFAETQKVIMNVSIPFFTPLYELERLLQLVLLKKSGTIALSTYLKEPIFGVSDLAFGVPVQIRKGEFGTVAALKMSLTEERMFRQAASALSVQQQLVLPNY